MINKPPARLEDHLGYLMRRVSNQVSREFERDLAAKGFTVAEWVLMRLLYEEASSPSHLAAELGMTQGAVSKITSKLENKGCLTRVITQDDRRGRSLDLTPEGRRQIPALAALADVNDARFFDVLTPDEKAALRQILISLSEAHQIEDIPTT